MFAKWKASKKKKENDRVEVQYHTNKPLVALIVTEYIFFGIYTLENLFNQGWLRGVSLILIISKKFLGWLHGDLPKYYVLNIIKSLHVLEWLWKTTDRPR